MKTKILLVSLMLASMLLFAGVPPADMETSASPQSVVVQPTIAVSADTVVKRGIKKLSRKEQRELGLLPRQVLRGTAQLLRDGDIEQGMTASEAAFIYVASVSVSDEYGAAWRQVQAGEYSADWDSILEFIEKLMELLLKFLPLFVQSMNQLAPLVILV